MIRRLADPGAIGELSENEDVQAIVDRIKAISERARQDRSADRSVLNALDRLVEEYEWPWRRELLHEDFSDGDFSNQPAWRVEAGRFWVDGTLGLRTRAPIAPAVSRVAAPRPQDDDVGRQIFGGLIRDMIEASEPQTREPRPELAPPEIVLPLSISPAFAIQVEFSVHNAPSEAGVLQFAVNQDVDRQSGYRLALQTGDDPRLDLLRVRAGRSALIDSVALKTVIGDGQPHRLEWRQDRDGRVELLLDRERLVDTTDRAFRTEYRSLGITNGGGDYAIRMLSAYGTQ